MDETNGLSDRQEEIEEDEMPKDGKKGRRRQGFLSSSDITLRDFADCSMPQSCGRVKKSVVGATAAAAIPKTVSAQKLVESEDTELSWFEKDLEDFVIEDNPVEEEDVHHDVTKSSSKESKQRQKHEKSSGGITYPVDLWYAVSNYVQPEDVGRFAGICKGTHSVTQTSAFWRHLYESYYRTGREGLPDSVKPHNMEKLHGLRSRVIRALFVLYPPLAARVQPKGPMDDEPHSLIGNRCLLAWHQPATKGWQFCFKFQKPSLQSLTSRPSNKMDVYNGYNDLFYNPEAGCSVLQVTCCHFASVAAVMGLLLNQVYVTLSTGFRHHRLRLNFDSRIAVRQNTPCDTVVLDDVLSIRILQWWHPAYPFTS